MNSDPLNTSSLIFYFRSKLMFLAVLVAAVLLALPTLPALAQGPNAPQVVEGDTTYLIQWGNSGSGDGQFQWPTDIAIDAGGNIYVVDSGNHRIQKFDSSGTYLTQWGSQGSGDGQFNWPNAVAVDAGGKVYIADTYNNRIQKFDSSGTYLSQWGGSGTGDSQFDFPNGVAVDADSKVYVTDTNNDRIQKFDSSGTYLSQWGGSGIGDSQFDEPYAVAVDYNGKVYVTDSRNRRIQKFDSSGTFLAAWGWGVNGGSDYEICTSSCQAGNFGSGDGQFTWAFGIAVDAAGKVYVTDYNNYRTQQFDSDGTYLTQWGSQGSGDGQFEGPYGAVLDSSGDIYVADGNNHRIQKFSTLSPITTTSVTMSEDGDPTPFDLTLMARDIDNDPITWSISSQASHGTATVSGTGTNKAIGYSPTANYNGPDSFKVQVSDGGLTGTVTVSVTIAAVNDLPLAKDDTVLVVKNHSKALNVLANDSHGDGLTLALSQVGSPDQGGSATEEGGQIRYSPVTDFIGTETFTYTISDGSLTATATVTAVVVEGNKGIAVDPITGGTLIFTDTKQSGSFSTTVQVPPGAVSQTVDLVYSLVPTGSHIAPGGLLFATAFKLEVYLNTVLQSDFNFDQPIILTLVYNEADLAHLPHGESGLQLLYWNGSSWSNNGITKLAHDLTNNIITFQINHLTEFALFGRGANQNLYLPLVSKNNGVMSLPDLVVDSINAGEGGVSITIRNAGNASVNDAFWVDLYATPIETPGLNKPWDTIAEAGAVWGVTKSLAAGESLSLTLGDAYYFPDRSSASFPAGAAIYALVDSINYDTDYGNVAESDESNNLGEQVTPAEGIQPANINTAAAPSMEGLPGR